jgi:Tfp pilus assembly protein PilO
MRLKVLILPLSLVVAVVLAIFFIKPAFSEVMAARNALKEKTSLLENLKSQNQKLQDVKLKWDSLGEEKTLVATALPETENLDSHISELFSKAGRSGILLSNVKVEEPSQNAEVVRPAYVCGLDSMDDSSRNASSPGTAVSSTGAPVPGAAPSANCLKAVGISMTAKGTWEQMLDFFKYLEDMNRVSEMGSVTLKSAAETGSQPPTDLLTASISINTFFKPASPKGNATLAQSLAAQGNFNQKALEKLKTLIYAPYDMPAVSPGGERNLFK